VDAYIVQFFSHVGEGFRRNEDLRHTFSMAAILIDRQESLLARVKCLYGEHAILRADSGREVDSIDPEGG
jgi:hypothetical protein